MTRFLLNETDQVSDNWKGSSQEDRLSRIRLAVETSRFHDLFDFTRATDSGAVYLTMLTPIGPRDRGSILLDLEVFLKTSVDKGINIWCEPIGDRNSLRNLRGVQIINQES